MLGSSRKKILFLVLLVAANFHLSVQDRCGYDEECKDVETCDEFKWFINRNFKEIYKLRVCGFALDTVRSSKNKCV